MPFLDVSDLLSDADIAGQAFSVTRSTVITGSDGQATSTSVTAAAIGSIQPASSRDLERLPQGAMVTGSIKIRTTYRLITGDANTDKDIVVWPIGGSRYYVQTVDDWSQFGAGYVEALATFADIN